MLGNSKVVWKEGMFLQPHHFQQAERYMLSSFHAALMSHSPYWYGVTELDVDKDAIANGLFTVTRCGGMLPDGVSFAIPKEDPPPAARSFADHLAHDQQALDVYLALPLLVEGKSNVVAGAMEGQAAARFRSRTITVSDEVLGSQQKEIEVGALISCCCSETNCSIITPRSRWANFVAEVHMPGSVDQVELVNLAILRGIHHAHRMRLNGDAALALEVHRIQHLRLHLARRQRAGELEQTVGKRALPMINMGDNREVSDE